jgi:hypothetical protein
MNLPELSKILENPDLFITFFFNCFCRYENFDIFKQVEKVESKSSQKSKDICLECEELKADLFCQQCNGI